MCVGNNPWPIGVTSVGIHERSSREKISHVMNGAAHIMNDEATRKYLQAIKRLLTFAQRAYPTDPSRCIDFDGFRNPSRGAAGGGSDKLVRLPSWHARFSTYGCTCDKGTCRQAWRACSTYLCMIYRAAEQIFFTSMPRLSPSSVE